MATYFWHYGLLILAWPSFEFEHKMFLLFILGAMVHDNNLVSWWMVFPCFYASDHSSLMLMLGFSYLQSASNMNKLVLPQS